MTDFANEIQERWKSAEEADKENRKEAKLDLEFAAGEQWDERDRQLREQKEIPLPCLTNNTIPQFVGQVIGDRRANQTAIKVLPREDGDKDVAEIRTELIRSIELQSKAQRVYVQAFEQAVTCGIGNFRVDLDYAYEDAFERDLFIRGIPNPLAVLWDGMSGDPTGADADHCFVAERIRHADYEARFGEKPSNAMNDSDMGESGDWYDSDTVRIAEYWQMSEKPKTVAMRMDGKVVDVKEARPGDLAINPATGQPYMRETKCRYATRILTNGKEELEEPFELKLSRLPIIRVMGREVWIGDKRVRFGLVRFIRDNKRLENYTLSVAAQKLMFMPRHNWMAEYRAIKGRQGDYSDVQVYNDGANPPVAVAQDGVQALVEMSQIFSQKMKEASGIYEANLGSRSNETSGVAIRARQAEGDNATIIYHDNMDAAQQEAGEVINELIPIVYDTARTIRTVGADDAIKVVKINQEGGVDLSVGRYDTTTTTGPAYSTQMQEQADKLMQLANASQKFADAVPDYIVKSLNLKHGDDMAERLKRTVPAEILGDQGEDETPEQKQRRAMAEQEAQELKDLAKRTATAQALEAEAKAAKAAKEADDAINGLNKQTIDAMNAETNRAKALMPGGFALPPEALSIIAAKATESIIAALSGPDVLPHETQMTIAAGAFDDASQPSPEQIAAMSNELGSEGAPL